MNTLTKWTAKIKQSQPAQTMTEYALILSAVAVVVFLGYQTMATAIGTLITTVNGKL